jgi:hypothetical protein
MHTSTFHYKENNWSNNLEPSKNLEVKLVLVFASKATIKHEYTSIPFLKSNFPNAEIVLSSTAGEIYNDLIHEKSILISAFEFKSTEIKTISQELIENNNFKNGKDMAKFLNSADLRFVMIFSDGMKTYGKHLIDGVNSIFSSNVIVSGGMSGDDGLFKETYLGLNDSPKPNNIVMVGFYGDQLKVSNSAKGGWEVFGQKRKVTKSKANILYEIDGNPALDLYEKYLGNFAKDLPGSALLYPFKIIYPNDTVSVIRTILSIDRETKSLIFAGDIPEGTDMYLMHTNKKGLVNGAIEAIDCALKEINNPELAIAVSCIGRKQVMKEWAEDEIDAIRSKTSNIPLIGFYSYGEFSTSLIDGKCHLHNETMCVTLLREE